MVDGGGDNIIVIDRKGKHSLPNCKQEIILGSLDNLCFFVEILNGSCKLGPIMSPIEAHMLYAYKMCW